MAKRKESHTGFRNNKLFCFHCGQSHSYTLPIPVTEFTNILKSFDKLHASCLPTWKSPEPDMTQTEAERISWWASYGEHGTSSQTIWCILSFGHLAGLKMDYEVLKEVIIPPSQYTSPQDPDDFRRCYLLLKTVPEWKERLNELKPISQKWENLVEHWDQLTRLLEDQLLTKKDNGMGTYMDNVLSIKPTEISSTHE